MNAKVPALLLLIGANVLFFGGNAALDLWQTVGPGSHFAGTVTDKRQVVPTSEGSLQQNLLTIQTGRGTLQFDVYDKTYADAQVGEQVTGELDSRGLLGHDEALRRLSAGGQEIFSTQSLARAVGQAFVFVVIVGLGGFVVLMILRRNRPRRTVSGTAGEAARLV
jgi:hypothetical protein